MPVACCRLLHRAILLCSPDWWRATPPPAPFVYQMLHLCWTSGNSEEDDAEAAIAPTLDSGSWPLLTHGGWNALGSPCRRNRPMTHMPKTVALPWRVNCHDEDELGSRAGLCVREPGRDAAMADLCAARPLRWIAAVGPGADVGAVGTDDPYSGGFGQNRRHVLSHADRRPTGGGASGRARGDGERGVRGQVAGDFTPCFCHGPDGS